jgi:hypothetical protein
MKNSIPSGSPLPQHPFSIASGIFFTEKSKELRSNSRAAFSLPDLLGTLAAIGLLGLLLFPLLGRATSNSKSWLCMNNLRQLTLAWRTYAQENRDVLVAAQSVSPPINLNRPIWINGGLNFSSNNASNWDPNQGITKSPLWPYCALQTNLFRCPADLSMLAVAGQLLPRVRSYSMNTAFGKGEFLDTAGNANQTVWRLYTVLTDIVKPAQTFVFTDEHPDSMNDAVLMVACTGADQPGAARIIDFPASYHDNASCCFSFSDGHAEMHKWLGTKIKPPVFFDDYAIQLNVPAGDSQPDIKWLADNTTVKR